MSNKLQLRRDTAANWEAANPVLAQGEIGLILDNNGKVVGQKIGDGVTEWKDLPDATAKMAKKQITKDYLSQEQCIDELFLVTNYTTKCLLKQAFGSIIFRPITNAWSITISSSGVKDGQVIPLKISSSSDPNYPIGMTIGYLITKDIATWKKIDDTTNNNTIVSMSDIADIRNSPKIAAYLYSQNNPLVIADGSIAKEKLENDARPNENGIEIILPNEVVAIQDDTLQIFHRSVIRCVNPYAYHIEIICSVGKNYPRYFTYTPDSSHIGQTYTLTYRVRRNDETIIAQKQTSLRVIAKPESPLTNKNILVVGASTYANGSIANEVKRRLTLTTGSGTPSNPTGLGLSNIAFIGRKNISSYNINLEATGGYGWIIYSTSALKSYRFYVSDVNQLNIGDTYTIQGLAESQTYYLTIGEINVTSGTGNIRCDVYGGTIYSDPVPSPGKLIRKSGTGDSSISYSSVEQEPGNPFWNTQANAVDFKKYSAQYCNGAPIDAIVAQMGINDINSTDLTTLVTKYIKPFIRKYHEDYPDGKFFIGGLQLPSCTGGMSANYGASILNYYAQANKYWDYLKAIHELVSESEFSSYVHFMATTEEFDCENCYPLTETHVNNRVNITETLGTNGVHPTDDGGKMLSDAIYRALAYSLLS